MPFSELSFQPRVAQFLRRIVENDRVGHAYMFYGSEGAGKQFAARLFAQAINCERGSGDPCGICHSCDQIARSMNPDDCVHPDISHLAPGRWSGSDGKKQSSHTIVIDAVRSLQKQLFNAPLQAKFRIVFVHEVDRMLIPAQNAFLKTLEEPLQLLRTIFILQTTRPLALLPTIRSRCHEVFFGAISKDMIREILGNKFDIDSRDLERIVRFANGNLQVAIDLATDAADGEPIEAEQSHWLDAWHEAAVSGAAHYSVFSDIGRNRTELAKLIDTLAAWHRDLLAVASGAGKHDIIHIDRLEALTTESQVGAGEIIRRLEKLTELRKGLDVFIRGDLAMQSLLLDILSPNRKSDISP